MKRMYIHPQTEVAAMEMAMNLCRVSADGNVKINNTNPITGIKIE